VFDVLASLALLALTWPVMLLTVMAIKIEEGPAASVLYRQVRVGERGQPFRLFKFRSMREDAERDGRARWAAANDDRVTRVGRIIRKLRIDELPQIINVLNGEMSLVGPRPERPEFVSQLNTKIPLYRERHVIKPGITGWAQLCYPYGSNETDAAEKLQYDLFYVKNRTLLFYLAILVQTVEVILWGKGAR
jgi:lipopolysaccharide/colanic/teichoic acid biosynthesis glycosyltransferase